MTNPPKKAGTAAETKLVRYLAGLRIPAIRPALHGTADVGDVHAFGGRIVIEVKYRRARPSEEAIREFWQEADLEASRVPGCDIAAVVLNRPGKASPAHWWAFLTLADLTWLAGVDPDNLPGWCGNALVRIDVAEFARLAAFHPELTQLLTGAPQ